MAKKTFRIERTYEAAIDDVWALWTTKDGIESWWGPEGFGVKVRKLELRTGGFMDYAMIAMAPEMIEFMKSASAPTSTEHRISFTEVLENRRLAYSHVVDFVPGTKAYPVDITVDFEVVGDEVRITLTSDVMHDELWTGRARLGWEQELGKLAKVLAKR